MNQSLAEFGTVFELVARFGAGKEKRAARVRDAARAIKLQRAGQSDGVASKGRVAERLR
jgi:hypothetical protein